MTSRRLLLAAALVAGFASLAPAAFSAPATVEAAEKEWYDALIAADGPRLEALIGDDFAYQHPTGNTYGKAAFIAEFVSRNVTIDQLGAVERKVCDYGPTVVVYGANPIAGMLSGQRYAGTIRWVNIWRQDGAGWRIVHRNSQILAP